MFPTYNWDFCGGKTFDYKSTPCMTGTLGALALKRKDFVRTKHPIYSFAVYGKYQSEFFKMENKDSFGLDSPFAFFKEHDVKNYIIDVSLQDCFTFVHFAEEQSGVVKHRYVKDFTAGYIDENGIESKKTYSMFVRNLDLDVRTTINPIENDLINRNAERIFCVNNSKIKEVHLGQAYNVLLEDILHNRSRKLCTYKNQ
ncbi:MAG: AAC(3) family N-acetyltransferase [Butyrivibrio sp.]|nr:AAC(3) family N-acetyltransferase [Butyrivibrio sp.]